MENILLNKQDRYWQEMHTVTVMQADTRLNSGKISPLQKTWNRAVKRGFDLLMSAGIILFILSWLIPVIACIIKLTSRGPIFFIQKRSSKKGRIFHCIKFRTMIVNNEADIRGATYNDKRITRAGAFLRRYHIDELPQAFNILLGDMSLIGPRPHMIAENARNEQLIRSYNARHAIKPGITGLAQSLGYSGYTEDIEKLYKLVQLDLYYINNWSIQMDLKIIFKTIGTIWSQKKP